MKVLFIVYHPVDPYIVFETAKKIENEDGKCLFVIIEKEGIIKRIIDSYGFNSVVIGNSSESFIGKILNIFTLVIRIVRQIKKFKPDVIFSPATPYSSLACRFNKLPLICWEDTETATFNFKYSHKRIDSLLLIDSFYKTLPGDNIIKFNGYKELAYLHPNNFKPDVHILTKLGLNVEDKIVLMRFSALNAMHDIGLKSEADNNDVKILKFIKKAEHVYNAKVFISVTERDLDNRFDAYKLKIDPSKYAHLLSFCSLYIGEGTTTASEAGVLGVPWIALRDKPLGYLIDQEEKYELGIRTENLDLALNKAEDILQNTNSRYEWSLKRGRLLKDKIDVSAFITWFIKNYPKSHSIMRENPDFQNKFK
ncbi:DUF354 domain-containing protein [Aureibaculum sp. 2210JD6-5]|uniref:DUF354 domain-containing protein n=1 Tax=Aureibaculum sp. 2210JD6-5 TaxID=3103957 RepID=UPI002AAEC338|nr:DUF354 domain-containing protein [Aureibaculum sp. 2210JD6-5]MDY7394086.1 DUF354 domain-containing protein [Aureibaculum sp. 2210JD6-5]